MNWTRPQELCAQVQKLWDRGLLLAELVGEDKENVGLFPKRLILKGPNSTEIGSCFDEVRFWISELLAIQHCRIEMRNFSHRLLGANSIPAAVWVDTLEMHC